MAARLTCLVISLRRPRDHRPIRVNLVERRELRRVSLRTVRVVLSTRSYGRLARISRPDRHEKHCRA